MSPRGTTGYNVFFAFCFLVLFKIRASAAKLTDDFCLCSSPECELPEAGDGVSPRQPQRLLLHVPDALLLVPAASSIQLAAPGALR